MDIEVLSVFSKERESGAKGARTPDLLNAIQALFQAEL